MNPSDILAKKRKTDAERQRRYKERGGKNQDKQHDPKDDTIFDLRKEIRDYKEENLNLREEIRDLKIEIRSLKLNSSEQQDKKQLQKDDTEHYLRAKPLESCMRNRSEQQDKKQLQKDDTEHYLRVKPLESCMRNRIDLNELKTKITLENRGLRPIKSKVELQQLIKIKSTKCNDHKQYYITNENDEFIINIENNNHMDWILGNDICSGDKNTILIEENVIYNINDKNVIDSIKMYTEIIGEIINYEELIQKFNITDINYNNLSFEGKIIFLFMATKMFESGEYLNNEEHEDYEEMYLFQVNDGVEIEDEFIKHEEDDVFSKHFINIGDFENIDFMKYEWYNNKK